MSEIALDEGTVPGTNFDAEVNAPVNVPNAQTSLADQGNGSLPASIEKSAIEKFIDQPAVRRAFQAVSALLVLLFCVFFYMWISAPGYRAVYPGMMESDRQVAFELLKNSGFDVGEYNHEE